MLDGEEMAQVARRLYQRGPIISRVLQQLRPYICPFEVLIDIVPPGAKILDIASGAGLFLALLAYRRRISSGRGFDSNSSRIALAHNMQQQMPAEPSLIFELRDVSDPWPEGYYDVVSVIDILHHILPDHQRSVIVQAASRVAPGGILLYKDMARRPVWRALASRLHDLLFAGQWIYFADISSVAQWASEAGLVQTRYDHINRFWYGHELAVFSRPHSSCR